MLRPPSESSSHTGLEAARFQPVIDATAKYGVIGKSFPAREIFSAAALR
jgi:hypothetical protein